MSTDQSIDSTRHLGDIVLFTPMKQGSYNHGELNKRCLFTHDKMGEVFLINEVNALSNYDSKSDCKTINLLSPCNAKYQAEASESDSLMHPWKEINASMCSITVVLDLPDDLKGVIMGGLSDWSGSADSKASPWKTMRRIKLLTAESEEQGTKKLINKLTELQESSSVGLDISIGRQKPASGEVQWEISSKGMESIRTELTMFCTQEGISVTSNEELRINLSAGLPRTIHVTHLTFKADVKMKVKISTPWSKEPVELLKHTPNPTHVTEHSEVSYKQ
jgi:hypothetical protein